MSRISVVICSFNEKEFIKRAIQSVVAQKRDNFEIEIIIGDDGSNDGSIEYIEELEKNDIILMQLGNGTIQHFVMQRTVDENNIIPSIRVSDVIIATGDYVCLLSADDFFCDDSKFKVALNFLESNPDYIAYVTGFQKTGFIKSKHFPCTKSAIGYWSGEYLHISSFIFRRFKPELLLDRFCDDTGFEFTLATLGKWKFDKTITFAYVQRTGSIMHVSNKLELCILEMMLFQDIMNTDPGYMLRCATRARYCKRILICFFERETLKKPMYAKYINNCAMFDKDIIGTIVKFDSLNLSKRIRFLLQLAQMVFDFFLSVFFRKFLKD